MIRTMLFKDGKKKALTLSYDDGVVQDMRLIDIMNKHSIKGTFNINSGYLNNSNVPTKRMSEEQVCALYKNSGHEVAIHGLCHYMMEKLSENHAVYEIIEDRRRLEKLFGTIIRGCAYPFGTYNDTVVDILKLCGIKYARTVVSTEKFDIPTDWLRLPATCHHNNPRLFELADLFVNKEPGHSPWLFYLWGHSYEFDDNDNWDVIEKFAEKVGNRDDIWYATNIEIYDYIEAYNSLITSADGSMVYNPTVIDVWMADSGREYCIRSGKTVIIE